MNILQINTYDKLGGAAKVSYDLHTALRGLGHDSKILTGLKFGDSSDVTALFGTGTCLQKVCNLMRIFAGMAERISGLQYFFMLPAGYLLRFDIVKEADIIHIHNTHGSYINLWAIARLSMTKPVVWTLHDMWPLTGHCAHSLDCERWKTGCGKCPALGLYPAISIDTSHMLWDIKSGIYKHSRLTLTVPSKWLKDKLSQSMLSHFPVHLIHNAVDTNVFLPKDKHAARSNLNLPLDRFILTFTADFLAKNPWKGFHFLVEAVSMIKNESGRRPYLVAIGNRKPFSLESFGFEGRCIGVVKDPHLMADYDAASDVYLVPSIAENSPLVILESMACGTPVVAFDVGGIPEVVRHKETGYISRYKDPGDFASGIKWIMNLNRDEYNAMSRKCVSVVNEKHTLKQQALNYLNLYNTVIQA